MRTCTFFKYLKCSVSYQLNLDLFQFNDKWNISQISGEHVAHFKFTVLIMPSRSHKITGLPFEQELYESGLSLNDPEMKVQI